MLCLSQVISAYGHMSYILKKVCQVRNSPALLTHSSKSFHKTNRPSSVPITLCLVIFVAYKCLECLSKVRHNVFTRSQPEFENLRYKSEGAFLWDVKLVILRTSFLVRLRFSLEALFPQSQCVKLACGATETKAFLTQTETLEACGVTSAMTLSLPLCPIFIFPSALSPSLQRLIFIGHLQSLAQRS